MRSILVALIILLLPLRSSAEETCLARRVAIQSAIEVAQAPVKVFSYSGNVAQEIIAVILTNPELTPEVISAIVSSDTVDVLESKLADKTMFIFAKAGCANYGVVVPWGQSEQLLFGIRRSNI